MTRFFTAATFKFLKDLAANNDRTWFKANQDRYEEVVRQPALDFIEAFATPLRSISPHFVADPRKVGGSLFRIQRDTRFSKDKTPYKTGVGIQFRHVSAGNDVHAPGYYLHIEPRENYSGVGLWRPPTAVARQIRQAIADDPAGWRKAAHGKRFADVFSHDGDELKRVPKEFDPDHPFGDDLRRKDFVAGRRLSQRAITSAGFIDDFAADLRRATPFMRFLCDAVGVGF